MLALCDEDLGNENCNTAGFPGVVDGDGGWWWFLSLLKIWKFEVRLLALRLFDILWEAHKVP